MKHHHRLNLFFFLFLLETISLLVPHANSSELVKNFPQTTNDANFLSLFSNNQGMQNILKNIFKVGNNGPFLEVTTNLEEDANRPKKFTIRSVLMANSTAVLSTVNSTVVLPTANSTVELSTVNSTSPTTNAIATTTTRLYECFHGIPNVVVLLPEEDQTWAVGCDYEVTCFTDPASGFTSQDIQLFLDFQTLPFPHQVVDNYTITATLNETQPGSYLLVCATSSEGANACIRNVKVGYAPLDVENFMCVSWSLRVLECNWTIPDNPAQEPSQDYKPYLDTSIDTFECACEGEDGQCSSAKEGCRNSCCSWKLAPAETKVNIRFEVFNPLGAATFNHTINNWDVVIPDEAENIILNTVAGSLEVEVEWKMPVYIGTLASVIGVRYAVEYRPNPNLYQTSGSWKLGSSSICYQETCHQKIKVDHPGAQYQVRVRLRAKGANFTLEDDGWWSKWSAKAVSIPPQRPWSSPSVGVGTFQTESGSSLGRRDVTLSWRPLTVLEYNGPNAGYEVNATLNGKPLPYSIVSDTYVTYNNISQDSNLRMEVTASNSIGLCNVSSVMEIQPVQEMPPLPFLPVVVHHTNTNQYEIIWRYEESKDFNFTVYLCTDKLDSSKEPCKDNLYWLSVGNVTSINVTLEEDFDLTDLHDKDIRFALSAETFDEGISSGMSWDNCRHPQQYRQSTSPPIIDSIPTNQNSASVSWKLECEDWSAVVEAVLVEWCLGPYNFSTPCESLMAKETDVISGEVLLTELEPATEYSVRLQLQYRENLSTFSSPKSFSTSSIDDPGMAAWLIGVISIGCIFMAVFFVLCFTYSKKRVKNFLIIYNKTIKLPTGIDQTDVVSRKNSRDNPLSFGTIRSYDYFPSSEDIMTSTTTETQKAKKNSCEAIGINQAQQINGGRGLTAGTSEEEEKLLQQGSSPKMRRSPSVTLDNSHQLLSSNGYIQASFPNEEPGLICHSLNASSSQYVSIHNPALAKISSNGNALQEHGNMRELVGTDLELSEQCLPSAGYVALPPPHFGSVTRNGYVISDLTREGMSNADDKKRDEQNISLPETIPTGYVAIQDSDYESAGSNDYKTQDQTNGNLPSEMIQQISSEKIFVKVQQTNHLTPGGYITADIPFFMDDEGHEHMEISSNRTGNNPNSRSHEELSPFTSTGNGYVPHPFSYDECQPEILDTKNITEIKDPMTLPSTGYISANAFDDGSRSFSIQAYSEDNKSSKEDHSHAQNVPKKELTSINISKYIHPQSYVTDPMIQGLDHQEVVRQNSLLEHFSKENQNADGYVSLPESVSGSATIGSPDSGISNSDENLHNFAYFAVVKDKGNDESGVQALHLKSLDGNYVKIETGQNEPLSGSITSGDLPPGYSRVGEAQQ